MTPVKPEVVAALTAACAAVDPKAVKRAIADGAQPGSEHMTAVVEAWSNKGADPKLAQACIEVLLGAGFDINTKDSEGLTPFLRALRNVNAARFLLERGADINAQNEAGWTALHYADHYRNADLFDFLLKAGCNWRLTDKEGRTAVNPDD